MPMTKCFIGFRLKQRLNELEKKIEADAKKCLTSSPSAPKLADIGGDVAGVQPSGQEPKET